MSGEGATAREGRGPRVLLAVCGGIAAYKACEVLRGLQKAGCEVRVTMTEDAARFVGAATFEALSGAPVATSLYGHPGSPIPHIELAEWADAAVVVPATANVMAKMACGIADDCLTTTLLACWGCCPVLVAPGMNVHMWQSPATQANAATLRARGVSFVGPDSGRLACGDVGEGKLAAVDEIVAAALALLAPRDLAGIRLLVNAGPTHEAIDPVRYIANRSTGKMGFAIAAAAARRGAEVTLVAGPVTLATPAGVRRINVESAAQMRDAMLAAFADADAAICSAAVADYAPAAPADHKLKKSREHLNAIPLAETADILAELCAEKGSRVVVGFAAETDDLIAHATEKLRRKGGRPHRGQRREPPRVHLRRGHQPRGARLRHRRGAARDPAPPRRRRRHPRQVGDCPQFAYANWGQSPIRRREPGVRNLVVGCHLSTANGYAAMAEDAVSIGATTFAFFTRNPRGGNARELDDADLAAFLATLDEHAIGPLVAHAPYTYNLCSAKPETVEFARRAMREDLARMERLPGHLYNFHPGSHVKQGAEEGVRLICEGLNEVLVPGQRTTVLLETMAGKGTEVGRSFEELARIIDGVEHTVERCVDTCHVADAGYDIARDLDGVLDEFDRVIGLSRLRALHLNDSKNPLGSHKDRHERIGAGPRSASRPSAPWSPTRGSRGCPMVLETPQAGLAGWAQEIALLRGLAAGE